MPDFQHPYKPATTPWLCELIIRGTRCPVRAVRIRMIEGRSVAVCDAHYQTIYGPFETVWQRLKPPPRQRRIIRRRPASHEPKT